MVTALIAVCLQYKASQIHRQRQRSSSPMSTKLASTTFVTRTWLTSSLRTSDSSQALHPRVSATATDRLTLTEARCILLL